MQWLKLRSRIHWRALRVRPPLLLADTVPGRVRPSSSLTNAPELQADQDRTLGGPMGARARPIAGRDPVRWWPSASRRCRNRTSLNSHFAGTLASELIPSPGSRVGGNVRLGWCPVSSKVQRPSVFPPYVDGQVGELFAPSPNPVGVPVRLIANLAGKFEIRSRENGLFDREGLVADLAVM